MFLLSQKCCIYLQLLDEVERFLGDRESSSCLGSVSSDGIVGASVIHGDLLDGAVKMTFVVLELNSVIVLGDRDVIAVPKLDPSMILFFLFQVCYIFSPNSDNSVGFYHIYA